MAGGNFQKRALRDWSPGRCGLLPLVAPWSRRQAAGQPQSCGFGITRWRIGNQLRQSAALASSAGAVWLKTSWRRLRGDRQVRNTRTMRSGVAGPGPHSNFGQLVVSSRALGSRFGITPVSNPFPLLMFVFYSPTLRIWEGIARLRFAGQPRSLSLREL